MAHLRGNPAGLIVPSVLYRRVGDSWQVLTPIGLIKVPNETCDDARAALATFLATRVVLPFRTETALVEAVALFDTPASSRTASFLSLFAKSADDLVDYFEAIQKSTVVVLGCGGIGSLSAVLCAGAGAKRLVLIDGDLIEESNLNRQLFWTKFDLGKSKVAVLAESIQHRFPHANVVPISSEVLTCEQLLELLEPHGITEPAVLIHSADKPLGSAVSLAQKFSKKSGIPVIAAGYQLTKIIVDSLVSGPIERTAWHTVESAIMPSFGPQNAIAAGLASHLAIARLAGIKLPRSRLLRHMVDLERLRWSVAK